MNRLLLCLLICITVAAQAQRTVTGRVVDAKTGSPLPGASIRCKTGKLAVAADANGQFSISCAGNIIIAASVGYLSKEITIPDTVKTLTVAMQVSVNQQEEVVVTGYATTKRTMRTQAASVSVLSGRTAGVVVRGGSGYNAQKNTEPGTGGNRYKNIAENRFISSACEPVSTFAADVDKASYSHLRRTIKSGAPVQPDAVKLEELINYFHYNYPQPSGKAPYSIHTELTNCPWNEKHQLMRVALQGRINTVKKDFPSNYVFLIDVSGSMQGADRLDLVQASFRLLLNSLNPNDLVSIVTYAGSSGLVLEAAAAGYTSVIYKALNKLEAGGSTAGGEGITLAYETARNHFIKGGNNRVILATDGDFNVGVTSYDGLLRLIEKERAGGIFLTCLGFGTGNYKDDTMELLADKGNGNYYYIDELDEAKRVLQKDFRGTINTIAKDVKIQVEFNSRFVQGYRLIGYENRLLDKKDFDNDAKDAGEIGEGHTVTVLYEIVPAGITDSMITRLPDSARCENGLFAEESPNLAAVRTRYKRPDGGKSQRLDFFVLNNPVLFESATENTRWAAAVAMFGMLVRRSPFNGTANKAAVIETALKSMRPDDELRREFVQLVNLWIEPRQTH